LAKAGNEREVEEGAM